MMKTIYKFKDIEIEISKKNIKNIYLSVKPKGTVHLSVPINLPLKDIYDFLLKKEDWLRTNINYFINNKNISTEKKLNNNTTVKYLGKDFSVKLVTDKKQYTELINNCIELHINDVDNLQIKQFLLEQFYINEAKKLFSVLLKKYSAILNEDYSKVTIKRMKTRWGSCNPVKRTINLNLQLIEKPIDCIEYVVLHELAHIKHPNHSKDFWNYVSIYMPDWKTRRKLLNSP